MAREGAWSSFRTHDKQTRRNAVAASRESPGPTGGGDRSRALGAQRKQYRKSKKLPSCRQGVDSWSSKKGNFRKSSLFACLSVKGALQNARISRSRFAGEGLAPSRQQEIRFKKMFGDFAACANSPNISFVYGLVPPGGHGSGRQTAETEALVLRTDDDPFRQPPRGRSAAATPKTPIGGGKGMVRICRFARRGTAATQGGMTTPSSPGGA